jgi:predicted component of type VI protein secretion system
MQPSLLHRFKINDKKRRESLNEQDNFYLIDTLLIDLFLLFSSRSFLSEECTIVNVNDSVLNYGVKVIDNSNMHGNKEAMQKIIERNILNAIANYEKRLKKLTIERYVATAEKLSFKVSALFNTLPVSFIVSWEISVASYSINVIR